MNKEIKGNNRIKRTRDLFKKTGDTKGTFHVKMSTIKHRNSQDLKEAERLRRGGKNTQKNYTKNALMTWITTQRCGHSPRARHSGMCSQVGLRKHY